MTERAQRKKRVQQRKNNQVNLGGRGEIIPFINFISITTFINHLSFPLIEYTPPDPHHPYIDNFLFNLNLPLPLGSPTLYQIRTLSPLFNNAFRSTENDACKVICTVIYDYIFYCYFILTEPEKPGRNPTRKVTTRTTLKACRKESKKVRGKEGIEGILRGRKGCSIVSLHSLNVLLS